MIQIQPIIRELMTDSNLTRTDQIVWMHALPHLHVIDFRPLKIDLIAVDAGVNPASAFRSLQNLANNGYLERGIREGGNGTTTFRLPLGRVFPRDERKVA